MERICIAILIAGSTFLWGCSILTGSHHSGSTYTYAAFDSTGASIVKGTLTLHFKDTAEDTIAYNDRYKYQITGSWKLESSHSKAETGPQTGSGDLSGSVGKDGTVWINLNPDWVDNNVFLYGRFKDQQHNDLEGKWMWSGFVGYINGDRFTALRVW